MDIVSKANRLTKPKIYEVVTPTGMDVFDGSKVDCNRYLKQALQKGSPLGFLSIRVREVTKDEQV